MCYILIILYKDIRFRQANKRVSLSDIPMIFIYFTNSVLTSRNWRIYLNLHNLCNILIEANQVVSYWGCEKKWMILILRTEFYCFQKNWLERMIELPSERIIN